MLKSNTQPKNIAFVYVDGNMFVGPSHKQIIADRFNAKDRDNFTKLKNKEATNNLDHDVSFGYFLNDIAVIEKDFTNTTQDRVASSLQEIGINKAYSVAAMHGDISECEAKLRTLLNA